ncbi:DNA polymerase V subunit UmuC [compost metagenome]
MPATAIARPILFLDLRQPGKFTDDLFAVRRPVAGSRLMSVLDEINDRYGGGAVRAARVTGTPDWEMCREMMSHSYTPRLDQLWKMYAIDLFIRAKINFVCFHSVAI